MRHDLNIRLLLMYHQSWFIFTKSGFARSGPGLKLEVSKVIRDIR